LDGGQVILHVTGIIGDVAADDSPPVTTRSLSRLKNFT
jgi:hypothetical protein